MKKKWKIILVLVLIALAGGAWWFLSGPKEPVYNGKKLSAWMEEVQSGYTK